jgi:restriction endonuclease S subunit
MSARAAEDKAKLTERLDAQLAAKKLTSTEREDRLAQHDELWRSKIENAIVQKIERAHLYSFNLPNYRSSLAAAQLAAWKDFAASYVREDDPSKTLEKQYRAIASAAPDELDELISGLDPRHTLELDIARHFLTGISPELFTKHPHLRTLQEIIASQQKTPRVKLKDVCDYEKGRIPTQATPEGPYPFVVTAADRKTADDFQINGEAVCVPLISSTGHGKASMHRIHYEKGKFAVANLLFALQPKDSSELNAKFLYYVLSARLNQLFVPLMKGTANVSLRLEDAIEVEFPLPDITEQQKVVAKCDRRLAFITGAHAVIANWKVTPKPFRSAAKEWRPYDAELISTGGTPSRSNSGFFSGSINWFKSGELKNSVIYKSEEKISQDALGHSNARLLPKNTVLIALIGATIGEVGLLGEEGTTNQNVGAFAPCPDFDPQYLFFYLMSIRDEMIQKQKEGAQPSLNLGDLRRLRIPWADLETQAVIAQKCASGMQTISALSALAAQEQEDTSLLVNSIWDF